MPWKRLTEEEIERSGIGLSLDRLKQQARAGAQGFKKKANRWLWDPEMVKAWRDEQGSGIPGPRETAKRKAAAARGESQQAPIAPPATPPDDSSGLLDPELQAALEKFRAGLGDGPLEEEVALCRRLFGRLSGLVLSWSEKRLEQPEDQAAFCDLTKTLAQVASRIERMEGRLIDLRRRHGELLPRDDVMRLLQGLADDVKRGSDTLADELVAAAQEIVGEGVDTDALRARAAAAVAKWRDGLAQASCGGVGSERAA